MLIQFVQNSGVAAGLIAVILLLRRVRRLPSGCLDALWIAALVRLFIPFNLPSPFSIYRLLAHTPQPDTLSTSLTQSTVFAVNPLSPTSIFGIYRLLAHTPQPDTLSTSLTQSTVFAVNPLSPTSIFGVVWAIGAAFALTHLALSYLRLLHICRNAQPVCDPSILQAVQNAGLRRPVSVRTHPSITFALTHLALSYLRLLHICRNAQPVCDPSILQAVQNAGLRRPVSVRTHSSITVPCTFGIMRPVILLPVDLEVEEDASMPYLLAHELTHIRRLDCLRKLLFQVVHELAHIRRLDCLRKLLFQVVRCVHWFNPLVWLMCRAAGRDLERACDTTVLDTLSGDQRAAYAGALLNLAHAPRTAPLYSTFGTSDLEERIYSIMTFKKRSMISVLMTAAVVMTTTSAFEERIYSIMTFKKRSMISVLMTAAVVMTTTSAFATNVPEQNQAAVCQTTTVVANNESSQKAGDDGITVTITFVDASTNPIDVENSLDVVSRETLPDGSIRLTLKDGSEVIAIKAVPSTDVDASTNPIDVENSLDVVSRETLPDGSIRLTLKDGSEVIAIKAVPSTEATAK